MRATLLAATAVVALSVAAPSQSSVELLADVNPFVLPQSSHPDAWLESGPFVYAHGIGSSGVGSVFRRWRHRRPGVGPTASVEVPAFSRFLTALRRGAVLQTAGGEVWFTRATRRSTAVIAQAEITVAATLGHRAILVEAGTPGADTGLWTTDGTAGGTARFVTLREGFPSRARVADPDGRGDRVAVVLYSTTDARFVLTDGTAAGTVEHPRPGRVQGWDVLPDGRLAWAERATATGALQLYVGDGTASGSRLLTELAPGGSSATGATATMADGRVWIEVSDSTLPATTDALLWRTDGTAAGTALVLRLPATGWVRVLGTLGGRVLAMAATYGSPVDLYGIEPATGAATLLLSRPFGTEIQPVGDRLLESRFASPRVLIDPFPPYEPDIEVPFEPGPTASNATLAIDGRVLFANSDRTSGVEPWITNGTASGTTLWADLNPARSPAEGSDPRQFTRVVARTFFLADTEARETRVFVADAAATGAHEIRAGAAYSEPQRLHAFRDRCVFVAFDDGGELALFEVGPGDAAQKIGPLRDALTLQIAMFTSGERLLVVSAGFLFQPTRVFQWDGATLAQVQAIPNGLPAGRISGGDWLGDRTVFAVGNGVWFADASGVTRHATLPVDTLDLAVFGEALWAAGVLPPFDSTLQRIDLATGNATAVGSLGLVPRLIATPDHLCATTDYRGFTFVDRLGSVTSVPVSAAVSEVPFDGDVLALIEGVGLHRVSPAGAALLAPIAGSGAVLAANEREAYVAAENGGVWVSDGTAAGTRLFDDVAATAALALAGGRGWLTVDDPDVGAEPHRFEPALAVEEIGQSCARLRTPALRASFAAGGGAIEFELESAVGTLAFIASSPVVPPARLARDCWFHIDLDSAVLLGPIPLQGGRASVHLPLPVDPALVRLPLHAQGVIGPTDHALGIDLTPALRLEVR